MVYNNQLRDISTRGKGVFNLSNQLSYFSKKYGMQHGKTEFYEFRGLVLPLAIFVQKYNSTNFFAGKHVTFLEISLKTMIWGNYIFM